MLETKDMYELDIDVKTSQEIEHIKNVILEHFSEKYFSKTNLQDLLEEGQTTLSSTYKVYKEFVFCILKLKKPFDLKIIFNPIDAEDGLITKVNCKNDKNNNVKFILENVFYSSPDILSLDYDEEAEDYITDEWGDETSRRRDDYNELFEENKNIAFNCKDLDLQDFLQLLSDF